MQLASLTDVPSYDQVYSAKKIKTVQETAAKKKADNARKHKSVKETDIKPERKKHILQELE